MKQLKILTKRIKKGKQLDNIITEDLKDEHFSDLFPNHKTVYGPVKSWRFGESLGIDPIFTSSTCSFNCIYCQLGNIQNINAKIQTFVSTEKVVRDFKELFEKGTAIDVITFSGSGEPTLAKNLGEISRQLKIIAPKIPHFVLTNGTLLEDEIVQKNLLEMDKVIIKLDAWNEESFQKINRPHPDCTLDKTLSGIKSFIKIYKKSFEIQTMFMPSTNKDIDHYAKIINAIKPELVQLNTPKRPYPLSWHRENRGNHLGIHDHDVRKLKTLDPENIHHIKEILESLTDVKILSIYENIK